MATPESIAADAIAGIYALVMEAFSGSKKDKNGRTICYSNGKRVKCGGPEKTSTDGAKKEPPPTKVEDPKAKPKIVRKKDAPIPPAPKTVPVKGLDGVDMHEAEHAVADAIKAAHGTTDLTTLRAKMKDRLPGDLFDKAMLQMHDDKVIHLNADGSADQDSGMGMDDSGAIKDGPTLFTTTTLRDGPKTPKGAAKKDAPSPPPTKTAPKAKAPATPKEAPKAKEAPVKAAPVQKAIAAKLKTVDAKTLAKIAKILGVEVPTTPAKKPAPKAPAKKASKSKT